ncbi:hypothetical protein ABZ543_08340 [Streptomyces roseifaciens]
MTPARPWAIGGYVIAYGVAVYAGTAAVDAGHALYAVALFGTSVGLLVGMRREFQYTARQIRAAADLHGGPFFGTAGDAAALEYAAALPPDCYCESWWAGLRGPHGASCPSRTRTDTR